jgi:hypothetical protein
VNSKGFDMPIIVRIGSATMASRTRRILALISALAIGLGVGLEPHTAVAAANCQASYVVLGQAATLTGPTSTDWFNVFGEDFDATVPATLTFGVPVIPWSIDQLKTVQPAVTTYVMPAKYMSSGFKWTFRTRDPGVQKINVRIAGQGCEASTLVDFSPPATSTADLPAPSEPSPLTPPVLLLAFAGAVLASWKQLDRRERARS